MGGNDWSDIRFAVDQGTLLWQTAKFGAICRRRHERTLLFALSFDNELADREATFKRLNGNNLATSWTNLVSFCQIISEYTLLKLAIFAMTAAIW